MEVKSVNRTIEWRNLSDNFWIFNNQEYVGQTNNIYVKIIQFVYPQHFALGGSLSYDLRYTIEIKTRMRITRTVQIFHPRLKPTTGEHVDRVSAETRIWRVIRTPLLVGSSGLVTLSLPLKIDSTWYDSSHVNEFCHCLRTIEMIHHTVRSSIIDPLDVRGTSDFVFETFITCSNVGEYCACFRKNFAKNMSSSSS